MMLKFVVLALIVTLSVPSKSSDHFAKAYSDSFPSWATDRNDTIALIKRSLSLHDQPTGHAYGSSHDGSEYTQFGGGPEIADRIDIHNFYYPIILAARIGDFTFSCRQDNGFLVVNQLLAGGGSRVQQINGEFTIHPQPGLWWFVKCVGFETGGYGLDMTGVSKPGGDSGINPNALKSLIG